MHLASVQFGKFLERATAVFVVCAHHRQRHKHFVGVQPRIMAVEKTCLGMLYRLDQLLWYQFQLMIDAG